MASPPPLRGGWVFVRGSGGSRHRLISNQPSGLPEDSGDRPSPYFGQEGHARNRARDHQNLRAPDGYDASLARKTNGNHPFPGFRRIAMILPALGTRSSGRKKAPVLGILPSCGCRPRVFGPEGQRVSPRSGHPENLDDRPGLWQRVVSSEKRHRLWETATRRVWTLGIWPGGPTEISRWRQPPDLRENVFSPRQGRGKMGWRTTNTRALTPRTRTPAIPGPACFRRETNVRRGVPGFSRGDRW